MRVASGWSRERHARAAAAGGVVGVEQLLHQVRGQELRDLLRAALGLVVDHEVAGALDHHELGAGDLALEAVGARDERERVGLAPEQEASARRARQACRRSARASRSRPSARSRGGRGGGSSSPKHFQYSSSASSSKPDPFCFSSASKPSRVIPSTISSPVPGRAGGLRHPVPLAVGEEAARADHERRDGLGVLAGPPEADQPAPVVHHERDPLEPELGAERLDRLHVALPGVGRVAVRVAEAEQVRGDRAPARAGQLVHRVPPHVGRLRIAVQQQGDRAVGRALLPVRELHAGEATGAHEALEEALERRAQHVALVPPCGSRQLGEQEAEQWRRR